ncbi:MAG: DUF4198 domain-containing protein [FCB group bacterium]|nr:DUF4198 domain-containing protein [FCB group bacterium]
MSTIRVTVLRDGDPVDGHRVVIEFSGIDGGLSQAEYTGSDGIAEFDVEGNRDGDVFVDGANVSQWNTSSATDITVNL